MSESEKRIPPFGLRLPSDLKQRVQDAATANNRSMNAEIIARLEASLDPLAQPFSPEMVEAMDEVARRTAADIFDKLSGMMEKGAKEG